MTRDVSVINGPDSKMCRIKLADDVDKLLDDIGKPYDASLGPETSIHVMFEQIAESTGLPSHLVKKYIEAFEKHDAFKIRAFFELSPF